MTLFILIFAFLIEQLRPLPMVNPVFRGIASLAHWLEETFNAGERAHGRVAWLLMVVPMVFLSWAIGFALNHAHPLLSFWWSVLLLYFTLGFRQFSHYFTDIQLALNAGNLDEARQVLTVWAQETDQDFSADGLDANEIVRHTVRQALIASHRHVFGVLFWTMVLPGVSGAVLYRLADYLNRRWNLPVDMQGQVFGQFAQQAFRIIDWVPVRLTAIGFAVVGNFEDAVYCWRTQTHNWPRNEPAILLASGAGALGVRLNPVVDLSQPGVIPEPDNENEWNGSTPELSTLQAAVGLVWRSVVLWMIVLVLVSVGSWIR
jgi:adenosylcobinamide-phosphate synthase